MSDDELESIGNALTLTLTLMLMLRLMPMLTS